MRERLHTAACIVLVLAVFTGCRGAGALLRAVAVAGYVGLRVAAVAVAAAAHSRPRDPPPADPPPDPAQRPACSCPPVPHGETWCEAGPDGEDRCVLRCEPGWVYRDGVCAPSPALASGGV